MLIKFPGQVTTPEIFVGALMDSAHKIKSIACVIEWDDGQTNTCHTPMDNMGRAWLRAVFNHEFKIFIGEIND